MIEYEIQGLDRLQEKFASLNGDLSSATRDFLEKASSTVEGNAKRLAPVDTGRLRASITHSVDRALMPQYAIVGTNVAYAGFQEYGTRHMKPSPYMRPGLEQSQAAIEGYLREMEQRIVDAWERK